MGKSFLIEMTSFYNRATDTVFVKHKADDFIDLQSSSGKMLTWIDFEAACF